MNVVIVSGEVQFLALRYDAQGKPELRFTLAQEENGFHLYLPCCASGSAAERLGSELEDGMAVVITSGKLCYRKHQTQKGELSRMEVLCWTVDKLTESPQVERLDGTATLRSPGAAIVTPGCDSAAALPQGKGKPRYPNQN